MIACLSPNGRAETRGDAAVSTLFVATLRGVRRMDREAGSWRLVAESLADKHISSLLYEPRARRLYAGCHGYADDGGLFASNDEGRNWERLGDGLASAHIYTLAAHWRGEELHLFCGTEPPALYRSLNYGRSWEELTGLRGVPGTEKWTFPPPPHIAHVKGVTWHPSQPRTLYALVEQGALLVSRDDGTSWTELAGYSSDADSFYRDVHRLAIAANDPKRLYLATGDGLYGSRDGGETWTHLQRRSDRVGYPDALFIDPEDDETIYLGGAGDAPETWRTAGGAFPGFVVSTDGGKTWTERMSGLPDPLPGNIEAMAMHVSPEGVEFFAGTAVGDVFHGADRGRSWSAIACGLPPVSKARHYRHFLSAEEKARIEAEGRVERRAQGLADKPYQTNR